MLKHLEKKQKKWFWFLVMALIAYTVKNVFVGADVDEGYGIMLGYRLIQGDKLLLEMWEPHQTSGIYTALFMQPFLWVTGGKLGFLNIYLRVIFFAVHGTLAWWIYRTVRACFPDVSRIVGALMAIFFYVSSPKCIFVPEYSNLQVWFTTALILCLLWYFCDASPKNGQGWLLVFAGVFMACDVLAYPSMAIVFPVCLGYIVWRSWGIKWERCQEKENKGKECKEKECEVRCTANGSIVKACALFSLPCIVGALLFIGYVLSYMSIEQIKEVLPYILGEGSHQTDWSHKLAIWQNDLEMAIVLVVVGGMLAAAAAFIHYMVVKQWGFQTTFMENIFFWFFVIQAVFQVAYWILGHDAVAYPQVNYLFLAMFGIYCYGKTGCSRKDGFGMILIAFMGYLSVALLSNWGPNNLNPYLIMGALGGILCWGVQPKSQEMCLGKKWIEKILFIVIIGNVFGYSYRMIGGDTMSSTILEVRGYNHAGLRAGILTNYMTSHRYNVNLENWSEMVPEGSTLLYVGSSQFSYMLGDCKVATPSTISTPTYDETLLAYWEMNPDRYPDVVAVESMYGEITVVESDSFLMQWLEEDFEAKEVIEYPYVTIYKR